MLNFLALQKHGKQWALVQKEVPGRTAAQIRTHAQKFFSKLRRAIPEPMTPIAYLRSKPISFFSKQEPSDSAKDKELAAAANEIEKRPGPELPVVPQVYVQQSVIIQQILKKMIEGLHKLNARLEEDVNKREKQFQESQFLAAHWGNIREELVRLQGCASEISRVQDISIKLNHIPMPGKEIDKNGCE